MQRIGVIGVGSIGSVLARGFSKLGHPVRINDVDQDRVDAMSFEAASKAELAEWADMLVLAVPTPTDDYGGDASAVDDVLGAISDEGTEATVVLRSTMPPGSTKRLAEKHGLPLVYSPEFLRDRSDVADFFDPDRIVIAGPKAERTVLRDVLDTQRIDCDRWFETSDYIGAEIAKEAHNAFFATKVSFANQMRVIAESADADPELVMDIVTADSRNTTSHLDPMLGPYGGRCLPKDTEALRAFAQYEDVPTPVLNGTVRMNDLAQDTYEYREIEGNWPDIIVKGD